MKQSKKFIWIAVNVMLFMINEHKKWIFFLLNSIRSICAENVIIIFQKGLMVAVKLPLDALCMCTQCLIVLYFLCSGDMRQMTEFFVHSREIIKYYKLPLHKRWIYLYNIPPHAAKCIQMSNSVRVLPPVCACIIQFDATYHDCWGTHR